MAHVRWIGFVAFLASLGYSIVSGITDTGMVAWMSQAQRAWPGLSRENFRPIGVVLTPLLVTWAAVVLGRRLVPGDRRLPGWMSTGWGPFITVAALLAAFVWSVGMAFYRWSIQADDEQSTAIYARVEAAAADPLADGAYVALVGLPIADRTLEQVTVSRRTNTQSTNHFLVPVGSPSWCEGQPVRYVVKVLDLEDLRQATTDPSLPLLGRVDGTVPDKVAQALAHSGVPLAKGALLVRLIPSRDGRPLVTDTRDREWQFAWVGSSIVSAVIVAFVLLAGWATLRKQRRSATPA